jgi:hypothetical protein
MNKKMLKDAICNNNIDYIKSFHELGYDFNDDGYMKLALLAGRVEMVKYLHEKCGLEPPVNDNDKFYVHFGNLPLQKR